VLESRDEYRPRPVADGIIAEVTVTNDGLRRTSYDLWKLFRDGRFYTLLSLFEDERQSKAIFWDTRTNRVTEALLFLTRLYRRLDASDTDQVTVSVRHGGLAGRVLGVTNTSGWAGAEGRPTTESDVQTVISASLSDLEVNLVDYVKQIVQPLFVVFDFTEASDVALREIVESFADGRVVSRLG